MDKKYFITIPVKTYGNNTDMEWFDFDTEIEVINFLNEDESEPTPIRESTICFIEKLGSDGKYHKIGTTKQFYDNYIKKTNKKVDRFTQIKSQLKKTATIYSKGYSYICKDGKCLSIISDPDNLISENTLKNILVKQVLEYENI